MRNKPQPRPGEDPSVTVEMDDDTGKYLKAKADAENSDETVADMPDEAVKRTGLVNAANAEDEAQNKGTRAGVTKYIRTRVRKAKL